MKPSISERIIKPENCVLVFGIPTSESAFLLDQSLDNKDYAKRFKDRGGWDRYYKRVVSFFETIRPIIVDLGVEVRTDVTLREFGELFAIGSYDVIILFSHWSGNRVEFSDGFADTPSIVEKVPYEFAGVIDLCVCHPKDLVVALHQERQNCLVKFIPEKAIPIYWLMLYLALFGYLKQQEVTYLRALEDVIQEFLKKPREKKERIDAMNQLKSVVEKYLLQIGQLYPEELGDERPVTEEDSQYLIKRLDNSLKSNNYIIVIAIVALCMTFATVFLLFVFKRGDLKNIGIVSGGLTIPIFGIIAWLRWLWIEKNKIAILLYFVSKLPPEQAANFTNDFYRNFINRPDDDFKKHAHM